MPLERFTLYVLGYRTDSAIEGDVYFQGIGYTLERKIDGIVTPVTIGLPGLELILDLDHAYGRFSSLTEEQRSLLPWLIERVVKKDRGRKTSFVKSLSRCREVKKGRFLGVHANIMQKGFREELIEELRERGKFVYASTGERLRIRGGPVPNGGVPCNQIGKAITTGNYE